MTAIRIEARSAKTVQHGLARRVRAGAVGIAQPIPNTPEGTNSND